MAKVLTWRGKEVTQAVRQNMALAMGEFGLRAEGFSKKELTKGHGVETGTLRRSIHTAQPGYSWAGDSVQPSDGSPERGGQSVNAAIDGNRITIQLGSGLNYALPVHQGHHNFQGYHFITLGVMKAVQYLSAIVRKHQLK